MYEAEVMSSVFLWHVRCRRTGSFQGTLRFRPGIAVTGLFLAPSIPLMLHCKGCFYFLIS